MDFYEENRQFSGLIKKYAQQLHDPHAEFDLWSFLWELKLKNPLANNDFYCIICLKNEFLRLQKSEKIRANYVEYEDGLFSVDFCTDIELNDYFAGLSEREKRSIILQVIDGFSSSQCAQFSGCSRQMEWRIKKAALKKMKSNIDKQKFIC